MSNLMPTAITEFVVDPMRGRYDWINWSSPRATLAAVRARRDTLRAAHANRAYVGCDAWRTQVAGPRWMDKSNFWLEEIVAEMNANDQVADAKHALPWLLRCDLTPLPHQSGIETIN